MLSPILISGLTQALVEAAFPESVPNSQSMKQLRPLIVGAEINAKIEVVGVVDNRSASEAGSESDRKASGDEVGKHRKEFGENNIARGEERVHGFKVNLQTTVTRVRDGLSIAEGSHSIWIPDYLRM